MVVELKKEIVPHKSEDSKFLWAIFLAMVWCMLFGGLIGYIWNDEHNREHYSKEYRERLERKCNPERSAGANSIFLNASNQTPTGYTYWSFNGNITLGDSTADSNYWTPSNE